MTEIKFLMWFFIALIIWMLIIGSFTIETKGKSTKTHIEFNGIVWVLLYRDINMRYPDLPPIEKPFFKITKTPI